MKKIIKDIQIALAGSELNYTEISIRRAVFLLSVPMVLEMGFESLFAIIDAFWVSRLGAEALATVVLTESVMFLIYAIAIGLSMATTAFVARRIGEKDRESAADATMQSLWIGMSFSIIIGIAGLIWAEDILRLMGADAKVLEIGSGYTRIMIGGNFTVSFIFLLNAVFRGAGDASLAMRSLVLANVLNIILDPICIFTLDMGVQGAAVATNLGRGIGVAYQVYILVSETSIIRIARRHLVLKWDLLLSILKVAMGGIMQYLIGTASWVVLTRIIATFGSQIVAGYGIAIRIIMFTILPAWGMSNAAATLVGQNLGAGKPDRAEKSAWQVSFYNMLFLLSISAIFYIIPEPIVSIFSEEQKVLDMGILSLRIISSGYIFYAFGMVISQAFNGAGDTFTPTLINFVCFWMVQIPLAYALVYFTGWGEEGVLWAIVISEALLALISIVIFRRGKWKAVKI